MSYAEIKKCINDEINTPINEKLVYTPSTTEARQALVDLGYTLKGTITTYNGTVYAYSRNFQVTTCAWGKANEICKNWYKVVNKWAVENGYGNICIGSTLFYYGMVWNGTYPSGENYTYVWTDSHADAYYNHYASKSNGYAKSSNGSAEYAVPVIYII